MTQALPISTDSAFETSGQIREAVGLFMTSEALQNAIRELEGSEFPRQDISVMGSSADLQKVFGATTVAPEFAMDNSDTPRQAPARPEEKTIGTAGLIGGTGYIGAMALALAAGAAAFPAIIAAVAIGGAAGGGIGALLAKIMGDGYKAHLAEQIEKGGLLLWVRTPDTEREHLAITLMTEQGGQDVHAHTVV